LEWTAGYHLSMCAHHCICQSDLLELVPVGDMTLRWQLSGLLLANALVLWVGEGLLIRLTTACSLPPKDCSDLSKEGEGEGEGEGEPAAGDE
jgi:hypothetical protein